MFSPKFLVNANEASKNVDVINENFRNIKIDLEYLNDLDKRISDIDARTKCVNPERIRRDYLSTKSELNGKLYGSISYGRIPQKDHLNANKLKDTSWEAYYEHLQPVNDNESDVGQSLKRVKTAYAYVVNALTGIYRGGLELASVFAPISHASNGTTYGISDASNYGHAKSSTTDPLMDGTADPGTAGALFANYNHRHPSDTAKANLSGGNAFSGKQSIAASSATGAGINYGGTGTAPSSPVDGDMWKTATAFFVRIASTTYQLAMLSLAQTWSAVQTFSSTPVISSTTAATTAGAMYRVANRGLVDYELIARLRRGIIFQGTTASSTITGSESLLPKTASFGTLTLPANLLQAGTKLVVTVYVRVTAWTSGQIYVRCRLGSNNSTADTNFAQTAVGGSTGIFPVQFIVAPIAAPGASVTCFGCAINLDGYAGSPSSNSADLATNATLYLNVGALISWGTLTATATIQSVEMS